MKSVLITGGAGFVGSNLAVLLKEHRADCRVVALDNLRRPGSELNLPRLRQYGVEFRHGDVRCREDLEAVGSVDWILDCAAEPSVLAGVGGSPEYVLSTNLGGTLHCLELARRTGASVLFLSTSRVYPIERLRAIPYLERESRFEWTASSAVPAVTRQGVTEEFPLDGTRTMYGATKLSSELIVREYVEAYGIRAIINRCGVLTGPWQMGKVDQGFVVLWVARHLFGGRLAYLGYGGTGKQVRDVLHVADLFDLVQRQVGDPAAHSGQVYNVGGGLEHSLSLLELTRICQARTGRTIPVEPGPNAARPGDIPVYLSDYSRVAQVTGWRPTRRPDEIVDEIVRWIRNHEAQLRPILSESS